MKPPIDLSTLSSAQKDTLILQVFEMVTSLQEQVKELQGRLDLNSRNSNKPPSSDGYNKPKPKSRRKSSGKRSGGQPGHKGGETLKRTAHPDHVMDYLVEHCTGCGLDLSTQPASNAEARQVFDIPPTSIEVTEHRVQIKTCSCCQARNKAAFPKFVNQPVEYGSKVQALVAYLSQYQMLPYQRLKESLEELFQLSLSEGAVNNILRRGYINLQEFDEQSRALVAASNVVHFDETGMRVGKQLHWVHVASAESVTCYMHHPNRATPAMEAMGIFEGFNGYAVHDHWASYFCFAILHVLCGAHILRELIHVHEQHQQAWAQKLIICLLDAKQEVDLAIAQGARTLKLSRIEYYDRRYSRILREGREELPAIPIPAKRKRGRIKQDKVKNLHDRLFTHKAEVLAFIYDLSLPFDNNLAERDARMIKVKQKISGCFRSDEGADVFCRIRGYISTTRKQGRNVLDALRDSYISRAYDPTSACLG